MGAWAGPFLVACVLLAGAGIVKALDPAATAGALRVAGVPVAPGVVRVGGALEAALAVVAAVTGAPVLAALVGLSYLAFTGFVVLALARDLPVGSCGCFGRVDTPPSPIHVVVNLGAVVACAAVALGPGGNLADVLGDQPLAGVPFLALVAVGADAAFAVLTVVPQLALRPVRVRGRR